MQEKVEHLVAGFRAKQFHDHFMGSLISEVIFDGEMIFARKTVNSARARFKVALALQFSKLHTIERNLSRSR